MQVVHEECDAKHGNRMEETFAARRLRGQHKTIVIERDALFLTAHKIKMTDLLRAISKSLGKSRITHEEDYKSGASEKGTLLEDLKKLREQS